MRGDRLRLARPRHDEGRKPEVERRQRAARAGPQIGDQRRHLRQGLGVHEPGIGRACGQRAGRRAFPAQIDARPRPPGGRRAQPVVAHLEMLAGEVHGLAGEQAFHHRQPFGAVIVAGIVCREGQAGVFQLGAVPGIDQIDGEAPGADLFDPHRHLGQHDGVIEQRLDGGDQLDARGRFGQRGGGGPGFQLVEGRVVGVGGVLGDQRGRIAQRLGFQHQRAVAGPGGIEGLLRVMEGAPAAMDQGPDAEARGGVLHGGILRALPALGKRGRADAC